MDRQEYPGTNGDRNQRLIDNTHGLTLNGRHLSYGE